MHQDCHIPHSAINSIWLSTSHSAPSAGFFINFQSRGRKAVWARWSIRLLKYPTGPSECFQMLAGTNYHLVTVCFKDFSHRSLYFCGHCSKHYSTVFVAGDSGLLPKAKVLQKHLSRESRNSTLARACGTVAWENCSFLLDTWPRAHSQTQVSHSQSYDTCLSKAASLTEVSIRIMSIKALSKILSVRTSILHIYLISHSLFRATMWDGYYYYYFMKKSKGRKVR